jgi:uncharacterized membrane protein HdeD (DUF308 family)
MMPADTMQQRVGESPCPMAKMCGRMMEKPASRSWFILPGALLILLGAFIFLEPRIVVWLAGTVAVLLGIMLLALAHFMGNRKCPSI